MAKRMLIDATHPEETRVVVLSGNRLEEFDFETSTKQQVKGNIYLAKVTRVEPSLQAAFVDYGGNRHGFLAFSEIHPDYYQIPVADRQALIDEEERAARAADDEAERRSRRHRHGGRSAQRRDEAMHSEPGEASAEESSFDHAEPAPAENDAAAQADLHDEIAADHPEPMPVVTEGHEPPVEMVQMPGDAALGDEIEPAETNGNAAAASAEWEHAEAEYGETAERPVSAPAENGGDEEETVESVGG